MENEAFKLTKRFHDDLLTDNAWLQHTDTEGLWEAIEKVVLDNINQPGIVLRDKVNAAIVNKLFGGRSIRLIRNYF